MKVRLFGILIILTLLSCEKEEMLESHFSFIGDWEVVQVDYGHLSWHPNSYPFRYYCGYRTRGRISFYSDSTGFLHSELDSLIADGNQKFIWSERPVSRMYRDTMDYCIEILFDLGKLHNSYCYTHIFHNDTIGLYFANPFYIGGGVGSTPSQYYLKMIRNHDN